MPLNVVDLFAGAGGLSLGFRQAGFKIIAAVEVSKHHAETYQQNFPDIKVHQEDIQDVMAASFAGFADVVIGAPPYDAFLATNQNRKDDPVDRLYKDTHGSLVLDFIDFVGAVRPKAFVLELPPDFAEDATMEALANELSGVGIEQVFVNFLNAADHGACTDRVSLIISNVPVEPEPPADPGLPVGALVEEVREGITNQEIDNLPPEKAGDVEKLKIGDFLEPIPLAGGGPDDVYPNWFRLVPDATAPPVYGFSRFVHPFEPRLTTVRENARLMGFPDNFVFHGNRNLQYEQVGNAVPVPLARQIAREVAVGLGAKPVESPAARVA